MDKDVSEYINKQPSPQREICLSLRDIIMKTYPGIKEEMRWGVPVYGERFYLGSFKTSVNMGFCIDKLSPNDVKLFQGTGKMMRHVKIKRLEEIEESKIVQLMTLVTDSLK